MHFKKSLNIRPEHFENFPLSKIKYYVRKHWKKSNDKPRQCIKKQQHYFVQEGTYSQNFGFSSSHVQM